MTPTAIIYFVVGLVAMMWPAAMMLFKRRVLGAQWMMVVAMELFGLTMILYSCLYNTFLYKEYLIVLLFEFFALLTPPMAWVALQAYTRPQGVSLRRRAVLGPALLMMVLLAATLVIGGPRIFRIWIMQGAESGAWRIYEGSWRYNSIVVVHYYLFWFAVVVQTIVLGVSSVLSLHRFGRMMENYYTPEQVSSHHVRSLYVPLTAICVSVVAAVLLFHIGGMRTFWTEMLFGLVLSVALLLVGRAINGMGVGAETLNESGKWKEESGKLRMVSGQSLGRELTRYVESEAYSDPDLTVFSIAEHFRVSEDQVIDAIHLMHGESFADYLKGVRVEHAAQLLLPMQKAGKDTMDPEALSRVAHQCGYLSADALEHALRELRIEN